MRTAHVVMTVTYWRVGRRIVEEEQHGKVRAGYGEELVARLAVDLAQRFGRGFGQRNVFNMRAFYLAHRAEILQTAFAKSPGRPSPQASSDLAAFVGTDGPTPPFPLPWSCDVRLLSVRSPAARRFYETEALRGGWNVRQLDRQIGSQFYERTALSRNKAALLRESEVKKPEDAMTPEEEIKDPYFFEFLNLKDEYSESDLEAALIAKLEAFLLELGGDFTFVGRQRRLRVGDAWYRIDLLFFHRRLRCLVIIDLKLDKLTHADAGQMHLYLNYAREHWMLESENPPVGLILCAQKDSAVAHYALEGCPTRCSPPNTARRFPGSAPSSRRSRNRSARSRPVAPRLARRPSRPEPAVSRAPLAVGSAAYSSRAVARTAASTSRSGTPAALARARHSSSSGLSCGGP